MKQLLFGCLLCFSVSCSALTVSEAAKEFIKGHEKCVLTAYWDSNGYSIGYGHHASDVYEGMKITKQEADRLFEKDIQQAVKSVEKLINGLPYKYSFSQSFIDGFVSFVYNTGESGARKSEFYKRLKCCRCYDGVINSRDLNYTIAGIKMSRISAPGHLERRYQEHKMMLGV